VGVIPYRVEDFRKRLDLLEKEIVHLNGQEKKAAVKEYHRLLHLCNIECQIDEPIYIQRS
jgi:hypothetical protein